MNAGKIIIVISLVLWGTLHFPYDPGLTEQEQIAQSYASKVGQLLEPVMQPLGLDWLTQLWNIALRDPEFRTVLPFPDSPSSEQALHQHLKHLYERLGAIAFDAQSLRMAKNLRGNYGIKRGSYDLPDLPDLPDAGVDPADPISAKTTR